MTIHIAAIHGIATSLEARKTYAVEWEQALLVLGVDCVVHSTTWASTGNAALDISKVLGSHSFRKRQIDHIIGRFISIQPDLILAHSMGQAFGAAALERLNALTLGARRWPTVPFFAIGGPLGHPVWGKALRAVGLNFKKLQGMHFYNKDDGVTALLNQGGIAPTKNWDSVYVSIAGNGGFVKEHAVDFYLTHPILIEHIKTLEPRPIHD